jgi:hypothetical protein
MGRIHNRVDTLARDIGGEALGAAEAADASGNRRKSRIGRRARQRQNGCDVGLIGDAAGERACFGRAAENEQAKALQWAAP